MYGPWANSIKIMTMVGVDRVGLELEAAGVVGVGSDVSAKEGLALLIRDLQWLKAQTNENEKNARILKRLAESMEGQAF